MLNLLKTDLKRLLKDKIILIGFLVTCALSLFTVVVFFGIEKILGGDEESIFAGLFTGRDTFLGSFSPSSNAGLMIPIFISVALIKDFRYGTVRNKIIAGKSRIAIFMSDYLAGIIFGLIFYITSSLISLLLGSLLLGYGTKFNLDEFGLIMTSYGYGILNYLVFLSCAVFIAVITKNVGLSITVNIVGSFLLSIVASVNAYVEQYASKTVAHILAINPVYGAQLISSNELYHGSLYNNLILLIPSICFIALFIFWGIMLFRKQDLK